MAASTHIICEAVGEAASAAKRGKRKFTIEDMRALAAAHGGECLSEKYTNQTTALEWRCSAGHVWKVRPHGLINGNVWCRWCAAQKRADLTRATIEQMQEMAAEKGGVCLSEAYVDSKSPLMWRCANNHEWSVPPERITSGNWCGQCRGRGVRSLDDMRELARKNHGLCLSQVYQNTKAPLRWRCSLGHEWSAPADRIISGTWCQTCSWTGTSLGERVTRAVLERMFNCALLKRRPDWLRRAGGRRLELDGYCGKTNIAFEYQGDHHYGEDPRFSAASSAQQQERDKLKEQICREKKVRLIVVPKFRNVHNLPGCIDQIEHAVLWAGIKIPRKWKRPSDLPDTRQPLARVLGQARLAELLKFASKRGGVLLSEVTAASITPLTWQCRQKHVWKARPHDVLNGHWCKVCGDAEKGKKRRDPNAWEKLQGVIADRRGEFLGPNFETLGKKYNIRCSEGHEWLGRADGVLTGKWCPECGKVARAKSMKAWWAARRRAKPTDQENAHG